MQRIFAHCGDLRLLEPGDDLMKRAIRVIDAWEGRALVALDAEEAVVLEMHIEGHAAWTHLDEHERELAHLILFHALAQTRRVDLFELPASELV